MFARLIAFVATLVACLSLPATAQVMQSSTTADLNHRLGPGTQYAVIGVIPRGRWVQVLGCTNPVSWCQVSYANRTGWASASYLYPRPGTTPPIPLPTPVPPGAFPPSFPAPVFPPGAFPPPVFPPPDFAQPPYPGQPGGITVVGTLTSEGIECPTMRGDDGRLYTLMGSLGPFGPGSRVRVHGRLAEVSFCMQGGVTIDVQSVQPASQ
jgi:hypothetical protein